MKDKIKLDVLDLTEDSSDEFKFKPEPSSPVKKIGNIPNFKMGESSGSPSGKSFRYMDKLLDEAVAEIKKGQSLVVVASQYGISEDVLYNKLISRSLPREMDILTENEESNLVKWILRENKNNILTLKHQLMERVGRLKKVMKITPVFAKSKYGRMWYDYFMKNHPAIYENNGLLLPSSDQVSDEDFNQWPDEEDIEFVHKKIIKPDPDNMKQNSETCIEKLSEDDVKSDVKEEINYIKCESSLKDGVKYGSPLKDGVKCGSPLKDGVKCGSPLKDGVKCESPLKDGVKCESPLKDGVRCGSPLKDGVKCGSPLKDGVKCESPLKDGVKCGSPFEYFDKSRFVNDQDILEHNENDISYIPCVNFKKKKLKYNTKQNKPLCKKCSKTFCDFSKLKRHMLTVHLRDPVNCRKCLKTFPNPYSLKRHMLYIHHSKPVECCKCFKTFSNSKSLNSHMLYVHLNNPSKCDKCDMYFKSKANFRYHKATIHGGLSEKPRLFVCDVCEKSFKQKSTLKAHIIYGHLKEKKKVPCDICKKLFRKNADMLRHKTRHSKVKPMSCAHCRKTFSRKYLLRDHIKECLLQYEKVKVAEDCDKIVKEYLEEIVLD